MPRKSNGRMEASPIIVRVSSGERQAIFARAAREGYGSVSELVRGLLLGEDSATTATRNDGPRIVYDAEVGSV